MRSLADEFGHAVAVETQRNGGHVHKAAKKVARTLTDTDRQRLVHYALVELESYYRRNETVDEGGGHGTRDPQTVAAPTRVSVRAALANPLDLIWPVGNRGRKPIGDWTGEDLAYHANYNARISRTYAATAKRFAALAEEVGDRTLREAADGLSGAARAHLAAEGIVLPDAKREAA